MAIIDFTSLGTEERKEIFEAVAERKGLPASAVEKDWWITRTLEIVFSLKISSHLIFKGGTSLSKAWKLINRFSEDIDLAIDKNYLLKPRNSWSKGEIEDLRRRAHKYIKGEFLSDLRSAFSERGLKEIEIKSDSSKDFISDPAVIEIYYPGILGSAKNYLKPAIIIEIGCRSMHEPYTMKSISSFVDEIFSGREFTEPSFSVAAVNPERTFLEKIFLLHEEFKKPVGKCRVEHLSRHIYDIYQLAEFKPGEVLLFDKALYQKIVQHRHKFNRVNAVNYNDHNPKTLNPVPPPELINSWKADYEKMKTEMIYGSDRPSFEEMVGCLEKIKLLLKNLPWEFDLVFPGSNGGTADR